jgi:hypothetical protein
MTDSYSINKSAAYELVMPYFEEMEKMATQPTGM